MQQSEYSIGDSDSLRNNATEDEMPSWFRRNHSLKMLEASEKCSGEESWLEFTAAFRPDSIYTLPNKELKDWIELFRNRGVYTTRNRGVPRVRAIYECVKSEVLIS